MEANELRIGNYIYKLGNVIQVENETFRNVSAMLFPYEPIPITEEWLFKFGFEQNGILQLKFDEYSKGFITLGKVVSGEELYQLIYDGKCFLTFLQYIHQLQNLYFALTNKELEIQ